MPHTFKRVSLGPMIEPPGGPLLRIVELTDGSGRVESWNGSSWVFGGADAFTVMTARHASQEEIEAAGADPSEVAD